MAIFLKDANDNFNFLKKKPQLLSCCDLTDFNHLFYNTVQYSSNQSFNPELFTAAQPGVGRIHVLGSKS